MNANFNEEDRPDGERVQSVQRALRILRCLADEQPLWGVTELSRRLAISKTVVARLLFTMRDEGFVSQDVASGKYRLGRAVFGLAANYAGESDLLRIGDRVLRQLVDETQLTAQIGVLEGPYQIPLVVVLSPKIMRVSIRPERLFWLNSATPRYELSSPAGTLPRSHPKQSRPWTPCWLSYILARPEATPSTGMSQPRVSPRLGRPFATTTARSRLLCH
jgi:hypothetical protein